MSSDAALQGRRYAEDLLAAAARREPLKPLTQRSPMLDLPGAYRVAEEVRRLREARGERVVGRKVGFTNRLIWDEYAVREPIWGYMYSTTVHRLNEIGGVLAIDQLNEPRIEPEIVLGLAESPRAGMRYQSLVKCIAWIALGFEIADSWFPGWRFQPADAIAGFGLHGALVIGETVAIDSDLAKEWVDALGRFSLRLLKDDKETDNGEANHILNGGPLSALQCLISLLAADPSAAPLAAGEIVATGTLTKAFPLVPRELWRTEVIGLSVPDICLRIAGSPTVLATSPRMSLSTEGDH